MSISTKEALKNHIHRIHDLIRNAGAGYGLEALKIFNFFYGLKILEPFWDKLEIKAKKFSELVNFIETSYYEEKQLGEYLMNDIFDINNGLMYVLNRHIKLRNIVVSKIPNTCNPIFYVQIIQEINKIPVINKKITNEIINEKFDVDIKGKTYEYFVGRDKTTIQDLGAYFTDRHIINATFDIVKPELAENGKVQTMIDPFGGSGGMTLSYIQYLNKKYPDINWKDNIDSINHFDMMDIVVRSCALETFALTDQIPNMNENYIITNSFKHEFGYNHRDEKSVGKKFKYVLTNPPYGGDKNSNSESETKKLMEQLKKTYYKEVEDESSNNSKSGKTKTKKEFDWTESWAKDQFNELKKTLRDEEIELETQQVNYGTSSRRIQKFCTDYDAKLKEKYNKDPEFKKIWTDFTLKDSSKDKEACSLILLMDLLDKNGTCIGVLKEGVFFNNIYSQVRKCLIDNYNVTHVISIPQDQFENTTTKTSIVIFKNNGKTDKIKFSEFVVEKYKDDVYEVQKVDVKVVDEKTKETKIVKANRLFLTSHKDQIIKVKNVHKATASYEQISAPTVKKLASGDKNYYYYSLNYKDYLQEDTYCPEGFKLTKLKDLIKYKPKSKRQASFENPDGKYRFYTSSDKIKRCTECDIKSDKKLLIFGDGGKGSLFIDNEFTCSDHNIVCEVDNEIMTEYIYNYIKNNWKKFVFKLFNGSVLGNIGRNNLSEYQIPIPKDISKLKPQLTKLSKLHNKISEITESIPQKEKAICDKIKELTEDGEEGVDWDEHELGDDKYFEIKYGNRITKSKNKGTKYPVYGGGDISFYTNEKPNRTGETCIIGRFGLSENCVRIIRGDIYLHDNALSINHINNDKIINKQLWYNLINNKNNILINMTNKTIQRALIIDKFKKTKIRMLKPKIMAKHKLNQLFDEVDNLKEELEKTKAEYQVEISKFMEPLKDPNASDSDDSDNDDEEQDDNISQSSKSNDNESNSSGKPNKSTKTNKSTKSKQVEEEIKVLPFKKNKSESKTKSKVETDSDSDSSSESDSSSDSDSEPETKTKAKAKTKSSSTKKPSPVKNITVESDSEDESTNKKSSSKSKSVKSVKSTNSTKSTKSEPVDKKIKSKSTKPTDSEDEEELERQLSK